MMRKKIFYISLIFLLVLLIMSNFVVCMAETDPTKAMMGMKDDGTADSIDSTVTGKLGTIINAAIALIQIAGTGISLIMVTILGIKYLLAAPSDKADVKKHITPMLIGAIILFGSVNLVQIIANFTPTIFGEGK